jgi:hypothetical protein
VSNYRIEPAGDRVAVFDGNKCKGEVKPDQADLLIRILTAMTAAQAVSAACQSALQ